MRVLGNRILVEYQEPKSRSGLVIVGDKNRWRRGTILSIGEGADVNALGLAVGVDVLYDSHTVRNFKEYLEGEKVLVDHVHVLLAFEEGDSDLIRQ